MVCEMPTFEWLQSCSTGGQSSPDTKLAFCFTAYVLQDDAQPLRNSSLACQDTVVRSDTDSREVSSQEDESGDYESWATRLLGLALRVCRQNLGLRVVLPC
jgi:hypothetical protein